MGVDIARTGDAEDSKAVTTTLDKGEAVELMRAQDWDSTSTNVNTVGIMETVCT